VRRDVWGMSKAAPVAMPGWAGDLRWTLTRLHGKKLPPPPMPQPDPIAAALAAVRERLGAIGEPRQPMREWFELAEAEDALIRLADGDAARARQRGAGTTAAPGVCKYCSGLGEVLDELMRRTPVRCDRCGGTGRAAACAAAGATAAPGGAKGQGDAGDAAEGRIGG